MKVGVTLWIALSGGRDSVCLLDLVCKQWAELPESTRPILQALHVNHHMQKCAARLEAFCIAHCRTLNIPITVEHAYTASGTEARARSARYELFYRLLRSEDVLWLAHHQDDQAETFMLRAMRGSGVTGLSAMQASRQLGRGKLERPLLCVPRAYLKTWLDRRGLEWVDDDSNSYDFFDRNYLRHYITSSLSLRWPQYSRALYACASQAREADQLLSSLAHTLIDTVEVERLESGVRLSIDALLTFPYGHQRLIIRHLIKSTGLVLPPRRRLETLITQLSYRRDKEVCVCCTGVEMRCWRGRLYFFANHAFDPDQLLTHWKLYRYGRHIAVDELNLNRMELLKLKHMPPWERSLTRVVSWRLAPVALLGEQIALCADNWKATIKE